MKTSKIHFISKKVITYELITIISIITLIWLDEIIDIPHLFLGAKSTPINWRESLFESIVIIFFGTIIINNSNILFRKMKYLEGILPVCAHCKKIRDNKDNWHQIESYIRDMSEAEFSHTICPECAKKLYPNLNMNKKS